MNFRKLHLMLVISIIGIATLLSIPANAKSISRNSHRYSKTVKSVSQRSGRVVPRTLLSRGLSMVGSRYRYGGTSSRGVDCSGLMKVIYQKEGIALPHSARQQYRIGKPISSGKLAPGDLVFFNTRGSVSHVGMYIGNGKFLHAANPREGVRVDSLNSIYYNRRYIGARRILHAA